jgi:amino acid transporter
MKYRSMIFLILTLVLVNLFLPIGIGNRVAKAADINADIQEQMNDLKDTGLPGTTESDTKGLLTKTIVKVIRYLLGFLAVIFMVLILYAGFRWMTSGGNEEAIESAKKTIGSAVIGLVIILFAYALTTFVFEVLLKQNS